MAIMKKSNTLSPEAIINMPPEEFKAAGVQLLEKIGAFLHDLPEKPVTTAEQPSVIRTHLIQKNLSEEGIPAKDLLMQASDLLFDHSLFNGHPRFWGYITSSAAPIGALAELLAASVNANVGAFALSPMATEIERQTIEWIGDFVGYAPQSKGVFVSGGNMANFIGFLAARRATIQGIRESGIPRIPKKKMPRGMPVTKPEPQEKPKHLVYCAQGTHTWIQKATDLFGFGTDSIRWIKVHDSGQIDCQDLLDALRKDLQHGHQPFLIVGNAGSVSTGAVDDFVTLASIAGHFHTWFHIDGAYGAPAAGLEENKELFKGMELADSLALDPHKWIYAPLEAGCLLVKDSRLLTETFSFHPEYYNFDGHEDDSPINLVDYSMQNSRGFKALKVWLIMQQLGSNGLKDLIRKDISMGEELYDKLKQENNFRVFTKHLSIVTFQYVPQDCIGDTSFINTLNQQLVNVLQEGGKVFLSNAVIHGNYCLRVCFVNFRTQSSDLDFLIEQVKQHGQAIHSTLNAYNH
jgi:aromatic-L-amino-acid/L-tryptophan decarboxylase